MQCSPRGRARWSLKNALPTPHCISGVWSEPLHDPSATKLYITHPNRLLHIPKTSLFAIATQNASAMIYSMANRNLYVAATITCLSGALFGSLLGLIGRVLVLPTFLRQFHLYNLPASKLVQSSNTATQGHVGCWLMHFQCISVHAPANKPRQAGSESELDVSQS